MISQGTVAQKSVTDRQTKVGDYYRLLKIQGGRRPASAGYRSNLPKGGEDNFHHECPDPKLRSSNSGRDEEEKGHRYN